MYVISHSEKNKYKIFEIIYYGDERDDGGIFLTVKQNPVFPKKSIKQNKVYLNYRERDYFIQSTIERCYQEIIKDLFTRKI